MCVCVCVCKRVGVFDMAHLWTVATPSYLCCSYYSASVLEKNESLNLRIVHPTLAPSPHE